MKKLIKFALTDEEAKVIQHVTRATKMDCWFYLVEDEKQPGLYYVEDLEQGEKIQLDEALSQALDGFIDLDLLGVTTEEQVVLTHVLEKLGVIPTMPSDNLWD